MTIDFIKENILKLIGRYPIKRITLFGSRADGTNRIDSDVDLIIEFTAQVSILTLSQIKCELEELIGLNVDVIHGPIREDDMIEVGKVVELYAA
jgi:predicted nucleotidyltransferase